MTALRIYDEDVEYALPPALTFTFGASRRCDVPVRGRDAADRLAAMGRARDWAAMTWHERSSALGLPKTTLFDWFTSLGLTAPLLGS